MAAPTSIRRGNPFVPQPPLWHVRLTVAGQPHDLAEVKDAMHRLDELARFLTAIRYDRRHAEVTYWDEGDVLEDVAALALRLWMDNRADAQLPDWRPIGLEVLDRDSFLARGLAEPTAAVTGDVRPF